MKKKIVIFDATTSYMLMTAFLVAKHYYTNCHNVLYLNTCFFSDFNDIKTRLLETKAFSEVELIQDCKGFESSHLIKKLYKKPDLFHFFSYGSHYACSLYNICVENSIPVNLTEEGMATYVLEDSYNSFYEMFGKHGIPKLDLKHINEVWLFQKDWFSSHDKYKVREIDVDLLKIDDKSRSTSLSDLNFIFNFKNDFSLNSSIFFSQNFYAYNKISLNEQMDFYNKVQSYIKQPLAFKIHPNEDVNIYKDFNVLGCQSFIPWELVVMNAFVENKFDYLIMLSVGSTVLFSNDMILKSFPIKTLRLSLFHLSPTGMQEIMTKDRFEQFETLAQSIKDFYVPKSWEEFNTEIDKYLEKLYVG